jgi:hypothetical protein
LEAHDELDRIDTITSTTGSTFRGKGKAKAILFAVKKVSVAPLKPLPRGFDDAETVMAIAAHTPVLV